MWSSFTRMPYWIACLTGNEIYFMHDLHMKYGSVVRFSPNELSYTDAQAWRDVFGYQKGKPENLKAPGFQYVLLRNHSDFYSIIYVVGLTMVSASSLRMGNREVSVLYQPGF